MSRGQHPSLLLSVATLTFLIILYTASIQSPERLSPQGCRMSYMSPSYILQSNFNASWTRLARRYSLWLYREVGWESHEKLTGLPVLFIPGNSGSSRQVRSIASSATRQYYAEPYNPHRDFVSSNIKPLDFFAVDFNEDFSALHGPTLLSERAYTSSAIDYILSLYPPRTQIIVMGHSMGGIVALSLLPSSDISAIVTMSTPHSLPPARLDKRFEDIYSNSWDALRNDSTPLVSMCGGATDMMIPSETCSVDHLGSNVRRKKTVFTTSMEGTWTGVGHREMVWCHQVRWRVARAALELNSAPTNSDKINVLARWLRDEVEQDSLVPDEAIFSDNPAVIHVPAGRRLVLRNIPPQPSLYLLPLLPRPQPTRFILYVRGGTVLSLSPYHTSSLHVAVYRCRSSPKNCWPLRPRNLRLIPNPIPGIPFPVSGEGADESDGVVRFEGEVDLQDKDSDVEEWIGVAIRGGGDEKSWVLGGFEEEHVVRSNVNQFVPLWKKVSIPTDPTALTATIFLPNILSNSLLVYRIETPPILGSCKGALLPPLVLHRSSPAESYYHPTDGIRSLLLHTHSSGPFIPTETGHRRGVNISVYSSGECGISRLDITIDWWSSLGSWGLRYWTTVCAWAVGVVGIMMAQAWHEWEKGATFPTVSESLARYVSQTMVPLSGLLLLVSCLPLDASFLLGNRGEMMLSFLAPLVLIIASGYVTLSWAFLRAIMWVLFRLVSVFGRIKKETRVRRNLWSLGFILLLVATVVPSQVAFLACFLIHLFTCAIQSPSLITAPAQEDSHAQMCHLLLLLFWLLPLVAPVLAVWVRTLSTAGLTTPFEGDHNVLAIVSFVIYVEYASSSVLPPFRRASSRLQRYAATVFFFALAVVPFTFGGRYTYRVYTISNVLVSYLVFIRIGSRLWK